MTSSPILRRWLSIGATVAVLGIVVGLMAFRPGAAAVQKEARKADDKKARTWPLWGGTVSRNLVNTTEKNIARDWSTQGKKGKNILWSVTLGSKAYGGPIVSGGKIFIGTNNEVPRDPKIKGDKGIIMCFRESDGEFLWQLVHDKLPGGRVNDWPEEGICSSPVVEGNRLWYVSNRCEVICATTEGLAAGNEGPFKDEQYKGKKDGDIVWKLDMIKDLKVFPHNLATCSPLIVGDILFVITSNGVDEGHRNIPSPDAPSFLAIDKKTGKVLWQDNSPGQKIMHGQWSNPVYAVANKREQIIFPGGDGFIYSFSPRGKDGKSELLWKFDCNPRGSKYLLGGKGTRNDFVSTPVVVGNKLYIGVGQDPEHKKGVGHLWCIDITKEPKNADKDVSPYSDPKDVAPSTFDPKNPKNKDSALVWHYGGRAPKGAKGRPYKFGRTLSTACVKDGLLYIADFDGHFYCFDADTGKLHWTDELGQDTWSSPYWVDGHVYIGNEQADMKIYKHGKTKELVKTIEMDGKIRATPVAINGVLYVMTEGPCKLFAIKP